VGGLGKGAESEIPQGGDLPPGGLGRGTSTKLYNNGGLVEFFEKKRAEWPCFQGTVRGNGGGLPILAKGKLQKKNNGIAK